MKNNYPKNRLVYVDLNSHDCFHLGFNASSLMMFMSIFDDIHYKASFSSYLQVKSKIGRVFSEKIRYSRLRLFRQNGLFSKLLHYLLPCIYAPLIILFAKKNDIIFFNYNCLWALRIINATSKMVKKTVIIMCHGELEFPLRNISLNKISTLNLNLMFKSNYVWADNVYFCCLGESLKANLSEICSNQVQKKFISFEHSWIFDAKQNNDFVDKGSSVIKIGVIGSIRKEKWLKELIYVVSKLRPEIEVYALGRVFCDSEILVKNGINYIKGADKAFVSDEVLKSEVSKLDIALFLYPHDSYKLTASGALYDAIDGNCFIVGTKNDYFDYTLEQRVSLGRLFGDLESIVDYLNNEFDKSEIDDVSFSNIKRALSPSVEALNFRKTLINRKIIRNHV